MQLIRTKYFEKLYRKLPSIVRPRCERQLALLADDLNDTRLHTKPVTGQTGVYSFRITRGYRGLFYVNEKQQLIVFAVDHRKDIYRKHL